MQEGEKSMLTCDSLQYEGGVMHGPRHGPDRVAMRRNGDHAVAARAPNGRLDSDQIIPM
jgi:hypothetical protein